jgi:uncharacterized membrane protein YfcA
MGRNRGADVNELLTNPSDFSWPILAAAGIVLGSLVGMLSGIFGVGGGFLLTPLLVIGLGLSYSAAVGTDLLQIFGVSVFALIPHFRRKTVALKTALIMLGGSLPGVLLGKQVHMMLRAWCLSAGYPEHVFRVVMHLLFLAVLSLIAALLWRNPRETDAAPFLQRAPLSPHIHIRAANLHGVSLPGLAYFGVAVGLLTGLLGVGGGVVMMPILVVGVGLSPHIAAGTSLLLVAVNSGWGTIQYSIGGEACYPLALMLLAAGVAGARLGAHIHTRLSSTHMRRGFVAVIGLTMLIIAWDVTRILLPAFPATGH